MKSSRLDYIAFLHLRVIDIQKNPDTRAAHLLDQPRCVLDAAQRAASMVDLGVQVLQAEDNIVFLG